jgi:hypothetical protein
MSMITTRLRQRAAIYRDMARKTFDPTLQLEFTHRAERYETVAWAVEHERCELEYSAVEGRSRPLHFRPEDRAQPAATASTRGATEVVTNVMLEVFQRFTGVEGMVDVDDD